MTFNFREEGDPGGARLPRIFIEATKTLPREVVVVGDLVIYLLFKKKVGQKMEKNKKKYGKTTFKKKIGQKMEKNKKNT